MLKRILGTILMLVILITLVCIPVTVSHAAVMDPGNGNPVIPGYFADPSIHLFNGTYYIYGTTDGNTITGGVPTVWSSTDAVNWTCTKMSFNVTFTYFWAASCINANNKYYLYYSKGTDGSYVADSNSPTGPWIERGRICPGQIDAEPFIDTDGTAYLYFGGSFTAFVAKLNTNMISLAEAPRSVSLTNFLEGSFMMKRNGIYYWMYSGGSCLDATYNVRYATSSSPYGPFTEGATSPILVSSTDGTVHGPGHHSVITYNGNYYIVYQRHDNPHNSDGLHRQVCIDRMFFNTDGSIVKVVPTHTGVGALGTISNTDTNISKGKTVTASSEYNTNYRAAYACDDNNGTRWCAVNSSKPQWLKVDLGQNYNIKKCWTYFEYSERYAKYKIEYSTNNVNWSIYADRTGNTAQASPYIDTNNITARYVRITVTGMQNSGDFASMWEFKVFGSSSSVTVVDNDGGAPRYTTTGAWSTSASSGYNGGSYQYATAGTAKTATWVPTLTAGTWRVSVIYRAGTNRATSAKYNVATASGTQTVYVNQTLNNLAWITLGTWSMNAGGGNVTLDAAGSSGGTSPVVIADAVKYEYVSP